MLPRFLSQMPYTEEEEIKEVQPLQFQQKSLSAIAPTEFVEPMVVGSMLAEVEEELATILEETRIPQKEQIKQLCSCRSVESLSSAYHASSDAYSSSSDNGEDIESNTEEVPIENEEETVSELQSAPVFAPERPRSCPPMGISQKYSIREIRDPRLQAVRRWAQQSEALAIAEEPSTSSDSESHSEEGDYDYERSPPLSPISSANDSEGEWTFESLDKMPTLIGGVTEIEVEAAPKEELAMLPPPLESQEIQVQSVSTEWLSTPEATKEIIAAEAIANYNPFITSFVMLEELPMVSSVELEEMETQKTEITLPEVFKTEKVEIIIPEVAQEIESKAVIISIAEVVTAVQVQKKKSQKRKLPMKQRLRNSKKRTSKN